MNRYLTTWLIILSGCISSVSKAQSSYQLQDFFDDIDRNNPIAAQRELINDKTTKQLHQANTNWYPGLTLGGQATYQSDITSFPSNGLFEVPQLPLDQYKLFLDVQQNLYDGNITASTKKLIEAQSQVQLQKNKVDLYALKQQVIQNYIAIILVDLQADVLTYTEDNLQTSLNTVESLKASEMALPSDVNQIKSQLLKIEGQKLQLKYNRQTYIQNLETLSSHSIDTNAVFVIPTVMEEYREINRPELTLFEIQKSANEIQIKTIKSKNRPKISLFGTGAYGRLGLNMLNPDFTPYYIAGIRATMPIDGFYSQKSEVQTVKIDNQLIDNQKEIFNQNIRLMLNQNQNEALQLHEQVKLDKRDIEYKEQIVNTFNAQFKENITLLKDYLDKVDDLEQAQIQKNIHEIQIILNYLNRKFITGNLSL